MSKTFSRIELISETMVSNDSLLKSEELLKYIDVFDGPYVALAFELDAILWTGDLALVRGLRRKGFQQIATTKELLAIRDGL